MSDLYNTLGVEKNASTEEIKKAYKKQASIHHPDKGGDNNKMTEITHAYNVLGKQSSRDRYDATGQEEDVPFDKKFDILVNHIFMKIADNEQDVDYNNLVELFEYQVELQVQQLALKKHEQGAKLKKMEKVLKRLEKSKDKRIGVVVSNNMTAYKQNIALIDEEIKFLDQAIEVIGHHDYVIDPKPEQPAVTFSYDPAAGDIFNKFFK